MSPLRRTIAASLLVKREFLNDLLENFFGTEEIDCSNASVRYMRPIRRLAIRYLDRWIQRPGYEREDRHASTSSYILRLYSPYRLNCPKGHWN